MTYELPEANDKSKVSGMKCQRLTGTVLLPGNCQSKAEAAAVTYEVI